MRYNNDMQLPANPKFSIITCTYNRVKYIDLCIKSVELQEYQNYEHIFIDAFSTDGTVDVIKDYIKRHPERDIKLYQYPPKGIANALNLGVSHAQGDIVHFLHSDDFYTDSKSLARVVEHFNENPGKDWVIGNLVFSLGGNIFSIPLGIALKAYLKLLTTYNLIHHENTFVTREFILKYGPFEEKHKITIEYPMWLRAIKEDPPVIVDDDFTVFIVHGDSMSSNPARLPSALYEMMRSWRVARSIPLVGDPDDSPVLRGIKKIASALNKIDNS